MKICQISLKKKIEITSKEINDETEEENSADITDADIAGDRIDGEYEEVEEVDIDAIADDEEVIEMVEEEKAAAGEINVVSSVEAVKAEEEKILVVNSDNDNFKTNDVEVEIEENELHRHTVSTEGAVDLPMKNGETSIEMEDPKTELAIVFEAPKKEGFFKRFTKCIFAQKV